MSRVTAVKVITARKRPRQKTRPVRKPRKSPSHGADQPSAKGVAQAVRSSAP